MIYASRECASSLKTGKSNGGMLKKTNDNNMIRLIFVDKTPKEVYSLPNKTVLEVAHANQIGLEGACEGNLACSTCHIVLEKKIYDLLGEPSEREYDLLEKAFKPCSTSRLGCQVKVDKRLNNQYIKLPNATRNMAVDGFKPQPH